MTIDEVVLSASGISKSFSPTVKVLSDVSLTLRRGEVHALVGENGAGKSTLSRILAGLTQPDTGEMVFQGKTYAPRRRREAEALGVRFVLQELNQVSTLTVAESLFLDRLPHQFGFIDYARMNAEAVALMAQMAMEEIDPTCPIGSLGVGQQQMIEIAVGISRQCDVLILDEPTAALTNQEIERLFVQIDRLKAQGIAILYISHRMTEIQRISDRITVLRDGCLVETYITATIGLDTVIRAMVGRELEAFPERSQPPTVRLALRAVGLQAGKTVREVSLDLHYGEILGIAGLMGSGRTETLRLLFGADRPDAGAIYLNGSETPTVLPSPTDAVRAGIALVTENRKEQGLVLPLSIRANLTLARLTALTGIGGWLSSTGETTVSEQLRTSLNIRCASVEQTVGELSGGNQQKVVLGRWFYRDCPILMIDEPTRGIDIGAKREIYRFLLNLADEGKAILMVSSELPELMGLCDRILVLSAGRVAGLFTRPEFSEDRILKAALQGYAPVPEGVHS